jgi:hypothetical protein
MAPTYQEETKQKLSIGLASLHDRVNKGISSIDEKIEIIQDYLHSTIGEVKD